MSPLPSNPGDGDEGEPLVEMVSIELNGLDREDAIERFVAQHIGSGEAPKLVKYEDLPPLPAPPNIVASYLKGIFEMTEKILTYGRVDMPKVLYDTFQQCARMQGTTLEALISSRIFRKNRGDLM